MFLHSTSVPRAGRMWRVVTSCELLHSDWPCTTHQTLARARVLLAVLPGLENPTLFLKTLGSFLRVCQVYGV